MVSANGDDKTCVLIAEDSRIQAQILEKKLHEAGFEVRVAVNGALALESARAERPTIVISDIEMPEMTGYEFCSAMKSDPALRTIPFILLSTLSEPEDIIRGLDCGADNYVTKPYDPEFLIARVRALLETPLGEVDDDAEPLEVHLAGHNYRVRSGSQQVLNLLVSTFEGAVEKNNELIRTNQELTLAKEQLTVWNDQLEELNGKLTQVNDRMTRDLNAAARVQQSLLPSSPPEVPRARFAWKYLPCDELAGDFLNFFPLDERHVAAFVVDVSGHGVASSLLSVTIGRLMTPQVSESSLLVKAGDNGEPRIVPPIDVVRELNRRFPMAEQNGLYFTIVYGVLDLETLEFRYVLAGHPQVVLASPGATPKLLEAEGMAVGWIPDLDCEEQAVTLHPGDRIWLYSDGVPEAMDPEMNQFGTRQLLEVVELSQSQSLDASVDLPHADRRALGARRQPEGTTCRSSGWKCYRKDGPSGRPIGSCLLRSVCAP